MRPLRSTLFFAFAAISLSSLAPALARAQSCMTLRYTFQPDCYRADAGSPCQASNLTRTVGSQAAAQMELGPQIAVWLQEAGGAFGYVGQDGARKDGTLMVTNAVARRGIGNRPGRWDFLSGPLFPYGKRVMALPIWAHARGVTYPTVNMTEMLCQGGPGESCLGWHESYSSPEPYFCRPLQVSNLAAALGVDAISCPTKFNSEKGVFDRTTPNYYPPRSDLTTFAMYDSADARTYATVNDLDAVAAATPAYGAPVERVWAIPGDVPPGDYVLAIEVNKEFDSNASHLHPDFDDPNLVGYGTDGNFGQPSVVYQVPLHIDLATGASTSNAAVQISGYGDWSGATGTVNPPDATISTTDPGSGEARLLSITDPVTGLSGRVVAGVAPCTTLVCDPVTNVCSICDPAQQSCTPLVCEPLPPPPGSVTGLSAAASGLTAATATLSFANASADGAPVLSYDIRYRDGTTMTDDQFASAASAPQVMPGAPGSSTSFMLSNLKPGTSYTVGVRSIDPCGQVSALVTYTFETPAKKFTQLSGCFIATAAWGSAMAPDVAAMRQARDRLRDASTIFAVAADLYYRAGPAAAAVLERSDTARALVRQALAPVGTAAQMVSLDRVGRSWAEPSAVHRGRAREPFEGSGLDRVGRSWAEPSAVHRGRAREPFEGSGLDRVGRSWAGPSAVHRGRAREPFEGSGLGRVGRSWAGPSAVHRGRAREPFEGSRLDR
ncbi:MAG TPA: fibronectin type III domain-containing protein [Polyangia bacterium]|nr:fibronectin type III domain-containing protein [Polyangia bacterium]